MNTTTTMTTKKKPGRPRILGDRRVITLSVPIAWGDRMDQLKRELSAERRRDVTHADIMREALEKTYSLE